LAKIGKHHTQEEAKQLGEEAETEFRDFCLNNVEEKKPKNRHGILYTFCKFLPYLA
jgi:hypothetical protein